MSLASRWFAPLPSRCKAIVEAEEAERGREGFEEGYLNEADPSVLRFLIASRWVRTFQFVMFRSP